MTNCYFCGESDQGFDDFDKVMAPTGPKAGKAVLCCEDCLMSGGPQSEAPMDTDSIQDHMPAEYFTESLV